MPKPETQRAWAVFTSEDGRPWKLVAVRLSRIAARYEAQYWREDLGWGLRTRVQRVTLVEVPA